MKRLLMALVGIGLGGCALFGKADVGTDVVKINKGLEYLADSAGNQDGIVEKMEEDYLIEKIKKHKRFYILTMGPIYGFRPLRGMYGIYCSRDEIEEVYSQTRLKGQIGILEFDRNGNIVGAWSTWNFPYDWKREAIPRVDYSKIMNERFIRRR